MYFPVNIALSKNGNDQVQATQDIYEELTKDTCQVTKYIALKSQFGESERIQKWSIYPCATYLQDLKAWGTVFLPPTLYTQYLNIPLVAQAVSPVSLTVLMISFPALTFEMCEQTARDEIARLKSQGTVWRTGEEIDIGGYRGRITLCEPVRQGVLDEESEITLLKDEFYGQDGNWSADLKEESLLFEEDEMMSCSLATLSRSKSLGSPSFKEDPEQTHTVAPLRHFLPPTSLQPCPSDKEDSERRIYIAVELMLSLGLFSGDWVQVSTLPFPSSNTKNKSAKGIRWLRSFTLPENIPVGKTSQDAAAKVNMFLSPVLFFNMLQQSETNGSDTLQVYLRKSFGPGFSLQDHEFDVPQAKSVTLARVPSPASTDRQLQDAFITGMKNYFEVSKRIVTIGDLILLGVDETLARLSAHISAPSAESDTNFDLMTMLTQLGSDDVSPRADTFAWFKVIDMTIEPVAAEKSTHKKNQNEDLEQPYEGDATVDANFTKMVQSGTQKSRIPGLAIWSGYYSLPSTPNLDTANHDSPYSKIKHLISSTFSEKARNARITASILVHGQRGIGKFTIARSVAGDLGMHFLEVNCYDIVGETDQKTEAYLRLRFEKAGHCAPCVLLLKNIDALAKKKDDTESGQESSIRFILADCLDSLAKEADHYPVAIVATTAEYDKIPDGVLGCFRHDIRIGAPDEGERAQILSTLLNECPLELAPDVNVKSLAVRSAALVAADLVNVLKRAKNFSQDRTDKLALFAASKKVSIHAATDMSEDALLVEQTQAHIARDIFLSGEWLSASDFDLALNEARKNYSDSIGAPKIPNVSWDDVGGLASVKDDIMDTIQLPLEKPELFASGMKKRSGILFYGPPGTGKTLLAKAVATSFSLNFFSVKGPELLNMYIGESEANVRRVFQRARDARPCVVFFDELDSVAPKRGNQGDSGGVMDRIVSQLLSELDGMAEGQDGAGGVFVIGATNRPDLLDPALLRPGRFDKMLYLGVSDTNDAQLNILQALTRKFKLAPDLNLKTIAQACPFTYTGADFYALCSDAMLKAMTRQAAAIDAKVKANPTPISTQYFFDHLATREDVDVMVGEADFFGAMKELVPSVSQQELEHYKKVQQQFSPKLQVGDLNGVHAQSNKGKGKAKAYIESDLDEPKLNNGTVETNGFRSDLLHDDEDMYAS